VLLTATIFAPLAGALVMLGVPKGNNGAAKVVALLFSLLTLGLAIGLAVAFDPGQAGFQLGQRADWVPALGVSYRVGVDGISLPLVLLTAVLTPLAVAGSWRMDDRMKGYLGSMLVLETALLGVFSALDLFLFYIFWDAVLIPAYFMIGNWGGERRIYAAVKFVLYTLLGGLLMLVSILGLYYLARKAGNPTFDYEALRDLPKDPTLQRWLFAGFFAAFAVKTPLFPFHTWLPDAYTEARPTTTVMLTGVMSKMGIYGFLRLALPIVPEGARDAEWIILTLAVIGILYAAIVAAAQRDFNRLVAYSSVSHMGFMVLGAFAFALTGVQGAVIYSVSHGLIAGGLFLVIGMLRDRMPETTRIDGFGGLQKVIPRMAGVMLVLSLASAALPGLVGFVGEFLTLLGAFLNHRVYAILAVGGVVLGAVYILWAYQRMWQGEPDPERTRGLPDLSGREWAVIGPVLAAVLVLGLFPGPILDRVTPAAQQLVERVTATSTAP
jgi:NADH-quinone oxidoreductase subunit M